MDVFKKHKQIDNNGQYMHKRDTGHEVSYLAPEFLNMDRRDSDDYYVVTDKKLRGKLGGYLYGYNDGEYHIKSNLKKAEKYNRVLESTDGKSKEKGSAIREYAQTYGNHSASKRKRSFKHAAKHYRKAAAKAEALEKKCEKYRYDGKSVDPMEYIDARIDILNERLKGMLEAAEAKSHSHNDELLRKNAAKVKIYSAMLNIYMGEIFGSNYKKKIHKLQLELDNAMTEYKRLKEEDAKERKAEEEVERKKAGEVKSLKEMDTDQLKQEIRYILNGDEVDYIPEGAQATYYDDQNYNDGYYDDANASKDNITMELYNEARVQGKLQRSISDMIKEKPNKRDKIMNRELKNNGDKNFAVMQSVLGAYRKELWLREANRNEPSGLENDIDTFIADSTKSAEINDYLRGNTKNCSQEIKRMGDNLEKHLNNTRLDYDLVVRKSTDIETLADWMDIPANVENKYGAVMDEFMENLNSTSRFRLRDRGIINADIFPKIDNNSKVELIILCRKGSKVLDISHGNGITNENLRDMNRDEVLIAPNTKLVLKDIKELEDYYIGQKWKVYLETYIPGSSDSDDDE